MTVVFSVSAATFLVAAAFLMAVAVVLTAAFLGAVAVVFTAALLAAAAGFFRADDPLLFAGAPTPFLVDARRLPAVFVDLSFVRCCNFADVAFAAFLATLVAAMIGFFLAPKV